MGVDRDRSFKLSFSSRVDSVPCAPFSYIAKTLELHFEIVDRRRRPRTPRERGVLCDEMRRKATRTGAEQPAFVVLPPSSPLKQLSLSSKAAPAHRLVPALYSPRRSRYVLVASLAPGCRGPNTPKPDYAKIDANPFNKVFTTLFANRLADELGVPPPPATEGYAAVMRLVAGLNERANGDPGALTEAAVRVLDSLFPNWLPPAFATIFSKPMPRFSAWINALVTLAVTQWLMGPSKFADDGTMTVEIERCRYLEESGCVGTCINSCKLATESFFQDSMKLPLWIEPDFEDFSCKFKFGVQAPPGREQSALVEPCFSSCPLSGAPAPRVCRSIPQRVS